MKTPIELARKRLKRESCLCVTKPGCVCPDHRDLIDQIEKDRIDGALWAVAECAKQDRKQAAVEIEGRIFIGHTQSLAHAEAFEKSAKNHLSICPTCAFCDHEVPDYTIGDTVDVDGEARSASVAIDGKCIACGAQMRGIGSVCGPDEVDNEEWEVESCEHPRAEV